MKPHANYPKTLIRAMQHEGMYILCLTTGEKFRFLSVEGEPGDSWITIHGGLPGPGVEIQVSQISWIGELPEDPSDE